MTVCGCFPKGDGIEQCASTAADELPLLALPELVTTAGAYLVLERMASANHRSETAPAGAVQACCSSLVRALHIRAANSAQEGNELQRHRAVPDRPVRDDILIVPGRGSATGRS